MMPSYSGLYDGIHGTPHSLVSSTMQIGQFRTQIARLLRSRTYSRGSFAGLMLALSGAAAGGAALVQHKRVKSSQNLSQNDQGGLRVIETFDDVNRVTTAADETLLEAAYNLASNPSSYPVDRGGNGGGGKLGR
jgi:hypothetical protein